MAPLPDDETQSLRRCVQDLAALSQLSVAWGHYKLHGIVESLVEVLNRSLPVDFVYVRLASLTDGIDSEAVRTSGGAAEADLAHEVGKALAPLVNHSVSTPPPIIANPVGDGKVRLAIVPIGFRGDCGVLIAGSQEPHFPGQNDQLLLNVAANQAAVVVQHRRSQETLRQSQQELQHRVEQFANADRRKDEFLATLAHELRNPLAPIRNALQFLRVAGDDRLAADQAKDIMDRQLGLLVRLVDDLLDINRISQNKLELRKTRIALASAVENAVEAAFPLIESKGHTLTVLLPSPPVYLDADLTRLAQVFLNLLNNSAKFTDPGGRIELAARRHGNMVLVGVRDTGIGIRAEALPGLFIMFSQLDHSLDRAQGGLGIGLALVKGLVEMHGGTVEAHSAGVGQGSEFMVRLPLAQDSCT
jgi:signal transduction histidine kinase